MSRLYFHSPSEDVEVLGSERAWLGSLTDDFGQATIDGHLLRELDSWLAIRLYGKPIGHYRHDRALADTARLAFRFGGDGSTELAYDGITLAPWILSLNTVMRLGSGPLQLAARFYAQSELHGWIDGPNRNAIADLIAAGLTSGVFRRTLRGQSMGWPGVIEILRLSDTDPVVMSTSYGEQFPNPDASAWDADRDPVAWYALPGDEQWSLGISYLKTHPGDLEIKPAEHDAYHFGFGGLTWLDLESGEERTREVLELDGQGEGEA